MIKELHKSKNLWGYTIEQGGWNASQGTIPEKAPPYASTYAIRCRVDSIVDIPSNTLSLSCSDNVKINYVWIDENGYSLGGSDYQTNGDTATAPEGAVSMTFILAKLDESECTPSDFTNIMLVAGSTPLPYEPYGGTWNTKSYAKIVDTTQQVTSFPVVVRPMENTIPSWTIKGNMSQTGTPTPSSPITPIECGDRTGNLFDKNDVLQDYRIGSDGLPYSDTECALSDYIEVTPNTIVNQYRGFSYSNCMAEYDENKTFIIRYVSGSGKITTSANTKYIRVAVAKIRLDEAMVTMGATAPSSYEPYGYKIPISSANTTTPVYLGEVESERKIKKVVFKGDETENWGYSSSRNNARVYLAIDSMVESPSISTHYQFGSIRTYPYLNEYCINNASALVIGVDKNSITSAADFKTYLQQQYAAGTPVTIWYVLAEPTTGIVNEPLRKIGNYADEVSGTNLSVTAQSPTTIDVDTTLKPSEMDLTYTGKKMCGRKKRVNGAWV